jgi:DNA-binding HxlR family transcriptional regulator
MPRSRPATAEARAATAAESALEPVAQPFGETAAEPAAERAGAFEELVADVFARDCPSRLTVEDVAGKWGILALAALADGPFRFNALRRRVDGVSEKMLAQTLHALERDGMVTREVQATIPPHVEYTLTTLGERVAVHLRALIELIEGELPQVLAAQARYDAARNGPA